MGSRNFGIPEDEMAFFKNLQNLSIFVEGGTFRGGTAKLASNQFAHVYTIEKSKEMHSIASSRISESNVTMLLGDTREHLPEILRGNDNILFWLDAHWSGGMTYGADDECPLLEELELIYAEDKNFVVMIDDARLFAAPPPRPHDERDWPSLAGITRVIPEYCDLILYNDVIYLYPQELRHQVRGYFQDRVSDDYRRGRPGVIERARRSFNEFAQYWLK